jgi:phage shock protein C
MLVTNKVNNIEENALLRRLCLWWIRSAKMKKLYLSKKDSKILGICGSIGETYDIDPTLVRLITVFLCLSTGIIPMLLTYFIAWIIIPKAPGV